MTKKKKDTTPKINPYWLYGIVIILLLGLSFFGDNSLQSTGKTNTSSFERFLNNGDIDRVVIQNEKKNLTLQVVVVAKSSHVCHHKINVTSFV